MKKRYIVAGVALSMAIVGGIGSAVTMTTAIPKLDRYIVERRASLLSNKEIFNSSDKINQLNLGNLSLAYNTEVNIRKSTDNKVKVTATCINDKNYYDVNIKDGVLSVNIDENKKLDSNIRLQLNKDLNPSLDIKTKDGIDLRYYLVDKVTSDKIVKKDSLKEYKGTLYDYIKKIEPSYKENRATTNPAISVNAKSLRLIEKVDENN